MFDLHRFGRDGEELVRSKLAALTAIDSELRALETALGERREVGVLREPGIGSCLRCGALHGSADSFCPHCGQPLGPRAGRPATFDTLVATVPIATLTFTFDPYAHLFGDLGVRWSTIALVAVIASVKTVRRASARA